MIQSVPRRSPLSAVGFVAALLAAGVNVMWYVATRAAGVSYVVTVPGQAATQELPVLVLAVVSFVAVVLGTAGLWLLRRWRRGALVWRVLVVVIYLVSLANPITGASEISTVLCLIAAHTVVAAAALFGPGRRA